MTLKSVVHITVYAAIFRIFASNQFRYSNSCQVFVLTYEFMALHKSTDRIVALCKYQITISHKISHEVLRSIIVVFASFCKKNNRKMNS